MHELQILDLSGTLVTGVGLKELASLKKLQTLNLDDSKLSDAGSKELAGLKQLTELRWGTQVTDAGLKGYGSSGNYSS